MEGRVAKNHVLLCVERNGRVPSRNLLHIARDNFKIVDRALEVFKDAEGSDNAFISSLPTQLEVRPASLTKRQDLDLSKLDVAAFAAYSSFFVVQEVLSWNFID